METRIRNWLIVFFTGILAFLTIRLYETAVQQTIVANKSAEAALVSSKAAEHSIMLAEKSLKIGNRAYVCVVSMAPNQIVANKQLNITVQFKNYGKTPAYDINILTGSKIGGTGIYTDEINMIQKPGNIRNNVLPPSEILTFTNDGTQIITKEDEINIMNGNKNWYAIGKITYIDQFGTPHSTRYCFVFNATTKTFNLYDKYNDSN